MRKIALAFTLIMTLSTLVVQAKTIPIDEDQYRSSLFVFVDTAVADALWTQHVDIRAGVALGFIPGVTFEMPVSFLIDRTSGGEMLLDFSLDLKYHPWERGPFVGLSLAQMCLFVGPYRPTEYYHFINELSFGYTWYVTSELYVEPSVVFRDPSESYSDSFAYLNGLIPGFGKYRIHLQVGWRFLSFNPAGKE
jgi:hypothetical protein